MGLRAMELLLDNAMMFHSFKTWKYGTPLKQEVFMLGIQFRIPSNSNLRTLTVA